MKIIYYTEPERVIFLNSTSKENALSELTSKSQQCLYNQDEFLQSLFAREELMSTGLGFETAFPHSKTASVIDFFITIGISTTGINWHALDGKPVKMIFLIGGLIEEQEQYLKK